MADGVELNLGVGGETVATDDIGGEHHQRVKISVGADGSATDLSAAAPLPTGDTALALARGDVTGLSGVNKFGRATNVDSGVATDVWDGANATDDVDVWLAPTASRTHQVASSSTADDGDPAGAGAQIVTIYGLQTWASSESSESVTLDGTTNVPTANTYVIIHRMIVTAWGTSGPNVGKITATADTDSTVTAQINAGEGQTQMAVYGVPSGQTAYVQGYYASAIKGTTALSVSVKLLVNPVPDTVTTGFLTKHINGLATEGTNALHHCFYPYFSVTGPAIIKLQADSSAADTDVSGGFDLVLDAN